MIGKIVKGIAGFYYIHTKDNGMYECKAKGAFRLKGIKPLVGDNVDIDILDEEKKQGNINKVETRKNSLIRPAVSNVDQALVIFATDKPAPNLNLLDRFLVNMSNEGVDVIICFNKKDIVNEEEIDYLKNIYDKSGHTIICTSALKNEGIDDIKELLKGKTTVLAGPSGVGKSSIINRISPTANMQIGEVSEKIKRGRHTTRHSELFLIDEDTYIMDTPGFSSLNLPNIKKEELTNHYYEFERHEMYCRYQGCVHINEPECGVKNALDEGKINKIRYDNYVLLYNELKEKRRFKKW